MDLPAAPNPTPEAAIREAQDAFVAAWGQMAGAWGISRTMAEVHALLFVTGQALNTDEIMERLQISRGNASMSLRALLEWGIVSKAHKRGDRKEYFQAEQDVWAMFRAIVRERLKREVEPLIAQLHEIRDLTGIKQESKKDATPLELAAHNERLDELVDFFVTVDQLGQRFASPQGRGLRVAAKMLAKIS
ncbi:MAG: ArsR family transcriptional regulator [Phycisphaerales bacterium]|jgi:DNA-binding transcriptional regulator GbsR (MarR family)